MNRYTKSISMFLFWSVTTCAAARPVSAQDAAPATTSRPATVDVALGGLLSMGGAGVDLRLSATLPVTERRSVELFAGVSESRDLLDTQGVYGFQVRRVLDNGQRGHRAYSSFGLMGVIARYEERECPYAHCRLRTSNHVLPPVLGLVGGGADFPVRQRLAIHVEAQLAFALFVPVSGRMAVGVSVPLGRPKRGQASRE